MFYINKTVSKNILAFGNCVKFIFMFFLFSFYFVQDIERLSGSSYIFLLKFNNYISRYCCSCSLVFSCLVFCSIPKSEREREGTRGEFSCSSPIEGTTFVYFTISVCFPERCRCRCRCSCHIFLFVIVAALVVVVVACVFCWPFSHGTPNGAFGTFQRNSMARFFVGLPHNLNCLSAAVWSSLLLPSSATCHKLKSTVATTMTTLTLTLTLTTTPTESHSKKGNL